MKEIYKRFIKFKEKSLGNHHYFKMYIAEKYALWNKRKLINTVNWSKKEIDDFDKFWDSNYKKIKPSGNKLLQAFNDTFNKQYIPDFLYATKIESLLNPYLYSKIYSDKSLHDILYKNRSSALIPKTYLLNASGIFYNNKREIIDIVQAKEILSSLKTAVIKPIVDGNSGKGVIIGNFDKQGYDKKNKFNILSLIDKKINNFIVQETIKQSKSLNTLYPNSINSFRVISFISSHKVHISPISLRMGAGGNDVDNIHAGGIAVGINKEKETLLEYGYQLGYSDKVIKFKSHPDTNTKFSNFSIIGIKDIVNSAIKLHGCTPHTGIISWDFTLNEENIPVLIEANFIGQSMWFNQIVNKKPIYKDETINILKRLKK